MPKYTILQISEIVSGKLSGKHDNFVEHILIDSRILVPAENSLFVAIDGKNHDGHNYIKELYNKGVRSFIVNREINSENYSGASFVLVKNSIKALQQVVEYHRKQFAIPVLGITGSNGKTVVKEWISQLLSNNFRIVKNPKSYNSQVGVPLSVWEIDNEHNLGIFEAGISQIDEMQHLEPIISPTVGLFTNIGDAHQENFNTVSQKITEKLILFQNCKTLIYCKNHQEIDIEVLKNQKLHRIKKITWGNSNADYLIKNILKEKSETLIEIEHQHENFKIKIPFTDNASIENIIHCVVIINSQFPEIDLNYLKFNALTQIEMRMEQIKGINNCTLINDSYNCDIASLKIALDQINQLNKHQKKTLILSDIQEVNKNIETTYNEVSKIVNSSNISKFIGIGENISHFKNKFKTESYFFNDTKSFLSDFKSDNYFDEDILLKGARKFTFEKISNALQEKNHRTILEINMEALIHNLNFFRSLLKPETKIMVMVKAFSYGSGSYEIANLLQNQRVDYLGVAVADEGVELRKNGINAPVIIMNPEKNSFYKIIENNLEPEIYNFSVLDEFNRAVEKFSPNSYPIHIKLDTGMHRLGFLEYQIDELISKLRKYKKLKVQSIFSHMVGSSENEHDEYTQKQIDKFISLSDKIISELGYKPILHILNSGGIERWQSSQFDMVRLGLGLYGVSSVFQDKLLNISTLKTRISQIKFLKKNETVGYSRRGVLKRDSKIAIIPIGYADGLNRKLSRGVGKVIVNNQFAPIVGNICMDLTMIDVTDIDTFEGDEVIIFGNQFTVSDIAELLDTIPYEVLTGISQRVKRIYYK